MKKILLLTMILFVSYGLCFAVVNNALEREIVDLKIQIEQESNVIKKIGLERQIEIKYLEKKAHDKISTFNKNKKISVQQAIYEAESVRRDAEELVDSFEILLNKNKNKIISFYNEQIKQTDSRIKRLQGESQEQYEKRVTARKNRLEQGKTKNLFDEENEILSAMITVTEPFVERLKYFQTEKFYDEDLPKAKFLSIKEFNVSDFVMEIKYKKQKYSLEYDFLVIGKQRAELMCKTQNKFIIEPLFSVNGNLEKELTAFSVKHSGQRIRKVISFSNNAEFKDIKKLSKFRSMYIINNTKYKSISAGGYHVVGLKKNGTVVAAGNNDSKQCNVSGWTDIVSVSAGNCHTVGLKKDGTVVAIGNNNYGQCNVSKWEGIIAVSAGKDYTLGLKEDGTVIACGNNVFGQCEVKKWKDIVYISAGGYHSVGLKKNKTVVACGYNKNGQCNVANWRGIEEVCAGEYHTVALMNNKVVVAIGNNDNWQCNIGGREHIIAISTAEEHSVALRTDGSVIATGDNNYGQCDVTDWHDIVEVSAGLNYTVGLKKNGAIAFAGNNYYDQCDIQEWNLNK